MTHRPALLALLAFALVAAAYAPALANGFVWDDAALVGADPFIRSWRNIVDGWNQRLFFDLTGSEFFRPLQRLSFTLDYALFELRPAGYHATSILWHMAAMATMAWGARPLVAQWRAGTALPFAAESWIAWGAALVWGLHPLLTSAVTYIAGRADPMAACFTWLAVGLLLRAMDRSEASQISGLIPAAFLCLAAAYSKEVGLLSFALCTLALSTRHPSWRTWLMWLLLVGLALGGYLYNRSELAGPGPGLGPVVLWAERPRLMLEALADYARLVVAPIDLMMDRCGTGELPSVRGSLPGWLQTGLGAFLALGAVFLLVRNWRRPIERTLLLGAMLAYLPISNLFSLNASVAEHWIYQPLQWLLLFSALGVARWAPQWSPSIQRTAAAVALVWVLLLGVRTFLRQADWRSDETFFSATVESGGDSPRMIASLARVRMGTDPEAAAELFREALRRNPKLGLARISLARLALRRGDFEQARQHLEGWEPDATTATTYWMAKAEYVRAAGLGHGRKELQEAMKQRPTWRTRRAVIDAVVEAGQVTTALVQLFQYCETEPFRAEAWQHLADLARKHGRDQLARLAQANAWERDVHLRRRQEATAAR